MPRFKTLKSINSTCAEREKLYSSAASPRLLPVKPSAKFISSGEHLAPRRAVWADVQEPAVCSCAEPVLPVGWRPALLSLHLWGQVLVLVLMCAGLCSVGPG